MANQFPTWGKPQTIEKLCGSSSFVRLHPTMQERLRTLIEASEGRVGLGVGWRSEDEQRAMFLDRYVVHEHGKTMWDGKRWRKKSENLATAAPPGRSMHEIGLAADLAGDHAWVVANAGRFALKHFAFVNNEPWHVQPFELPNSRREYERAGKPWQSGNARRRTSRQAAAAKPSAKAKGPVAAADRHRCSRSCRGCGDRSSASCRRCSSSSRPDEGLRGQPRRVLRAGHAGGRQALPEELRAEARRPRRQEDLGRAARRLNVTPRWADDAAVQTGRNRPRSTR